MEQVFCKDCKHGFYESFFDFVVNFRYGMKCKLTYHSETVDLVTGRVDKGVYESCRQTRNSREWCDINGKSWVPKNSKNVFLYLKHK